MKKTDYLQRVLSARVYDVAIESPLELVPGLSRRLGNRLLLKREDLQSVFSFKLRGAYNKMSRLAPAKLRMGVITASAGNHAQGVALAARNSRCRAVIVMPVTTPVKVDGARARRRGGLRGVLRGGARAREAPAAPSRLAPRARLRPRRDRRPGNIGMEILR
jgi:threonine dehydratase